MRKKQFLDHLWTRLKSGGILQLHRSPCFTAKQSGRGRRKGVKLTEGMQ